jgi:hypothetical protein
MPPFDLENEDWLELYRFLLEQLEARGYVEIRRSIELAAAAPVFERGTMDDEEWFSRQFKGQVGEGALRRREPSEVFQAAVDVLWTRLVELPQVAAAIGKNLENKPIEFWVDYEEQYALTRSEPVPLSKLQLSPADQARVHSALHAFGDLLERPET